jgi:predicted nucleotidyltransferase
MLSASDEDQEGQVMTDEEKAPSQLYAEFSDEDKKLAEEGLADYAALLEAEEREDGQLSRLLDTLTEELRSQLGSDLGLLILYGSYARGEAQPDSDVDLFVVLRQASEAVYEKVRQVAYKVMWEADFDYVFSLFLTDMDYYQMLEQRGSSFLRNVQREGKVLWKAA